MSDLVDTRDGVSLTDFSCFGYNRGMDNAFKLYHINAKQGDLAGRSIFLCGSDERAHQIATHFTGLQIQQNTRGHHLYLGNLMNNEQLIPAAAISTGMGCPSEDIILNELYLAGGRIFLRIGTAGSLQPQQIKVGDIVVATAAVRDEDTSKNYIMSEYPAIASLPMLNAIAKAVHFLHLESNVYTGIVHTKASFYAREMHQSLLSENDRYLTTLHQAGVLATEMECSHLFVLASLYGHREKKDFHHEEIQCGAILAIVGDQEPITNTEKSKSGINKAIALGILAIKYLYDNQ